MRVSCTQWELHSAHYKSGNCIPLQSMHLRNLAVSLEPVVISHLLNYWLYTNPRFVLLWSTALMSGVVLLNLLSIFLTESSLKLSVSSTIQTSLILYSLSPIIVLLQIFPFSTAIVTDIALRKSRILFLIQWDVFEPPEALPIHTLSKLHYLIHELYLTNHVSFLELLNFGTHCHPLHSLNPKICHLLNLTLTNLILSPSLLNFPHSLSFSFVGALL